MKPQITLAVLVTLGFFSCLFYVLKVGYPPDNKDMINTLLGILGTIWTLQMNFFFGSSSSSKKKEDMIESVMLAGTGSGGNAVLPNAEKVELTVNPKTEPTP